MKARTFLNKLKLAKITGAEEYGNEHDKFLEVRFDDAFDCPHYVNIHHDDIASHTPAYSLSWVLAHLEDLVPVLERAIELGVDK